MSSLTFPKSPHLLETCTVQCNHPWIKTALIAYCIVFTLSTRFARRQNIMGFWNRSLVLLSLAMALILDFSSMSCQRTCIDHAHLVNLSFTQCKRTNTTRQEKQFEKTTLFIHQQRHTQTRPTYTIMHSHVSQSI